MNRLMLLLVVVVLGAAHTLWVFIMLDDERP